ncbi:hypothetical protein B484DRAFT_444664 [Ochromonadaceae sp. CCMP2298]|nr:hypothetical protein B484DRAFT_444664 [Ochromonadaceae sp. CCMP2298]
MSRMSTDEDFAEMDNQFASRDDRDEADDEQARQKMNGKLDALRSEVDLLLEKNQDLSMDKDRLQRENVELKASSDLAGFSALKEENRKLREQLDDLSPDSCPVRLKQEFKMFCRAYDIFGELQDKDFTVPQCMKILQAQRKQLTHGRSLDTRTLSMGSMTSPGVEGENRESMKKATADIKQLRQQVVQMNERIRIEKEYKSRAENEVGGLQKKVETLSGHMEKLVVHLKHEGAHKLRLAEQLRVSGREQAAAAEKADLIARKSAAKDRLLLELREGSKVLEDQLRLMDEKYIELRIKLDYARETGARKIKKAENMARELRVKFAFASNSKILDSMPMPEGYSAGGSVADSSWGGSLMSPGERGMGNGGQGGQGVEFETREISALSPSRQFDSRSTASEAPKEPTLDGVLDKIRMQEGRKQDWTPDKAKKLVVGKKIKR